MEIIPWAAWSVYPIHKAWNHRMFVFFRSERMKVHYQTCVSWLRIPSRGEFTILSHNFHIKKGQGIVCLFLYSELKSRVIWFYFIEFLVNIFSFNLSHYVIHIPIVEFSIIFYLRVKLTEPSICQKQCIQFVEYVQIEDLICGLLLVYQNIVWMLYQNHFREIQNSGLRCWAWKRPQFWPTFKFGGPLPPTKWLTS